MTGVDKVLARVRMTISLMLLAQAAEESLMAKDLDFKESMGGKSKFLLNKCVPGLAETKEHRMDLISKPCQVSPSHVANVVCRHLWY